jgi:hypothetical protein
MSHDKMIRMANQIAAFMASRPVAEGEAGFAEHLNTYWEPRMRAQFFDLLDRHVPGLHPLAARASAQVRRPASV